MTAACLKRPKFRTLVSNPRRVLVTGGTGFIGSHLASALYEAGYEVIITGTQTEQNTKCHKFLQLNLNGINFDELGCIDICFHQAANNDTTDKDREGMIRANVEAPKMLFKHLAEKGCTKFIYASSSAVYGNSPPPFREDRTVLRPLNCYAESKVLFDEFVHNEFIKEYPVTAVGLRYTNVYGTGEDHKKKRASMISQIVQKAANREEIVLFKDGRQKRDWVYIEDVVAMNMALIDHTESDIFNCGSGEATTFNYLVEWIGYNLRRNLDVRYIDCPFKENYQDFTLADMTKAKEKLDFVPENKIKDGIPKLLIAKNLIELQ
jgi:ADP-L-glycero-D-manno-heptose 6-epimerase